MGDPVRDVYVTIDRAIGDLIESAGDGATVLVLASHGMGPHYDATFLLDRMDRVPGIAVASGHVKTGDRIVITAGIPVGVSGSTNTIKASVVGG